MTPSLTVFSFANSDPRPFNRPWRASVVFALSALALGASAALAASPLDSYAPYDTYVAQVQELDREEAAAVASLGKTAGGRDVLLITLGLGDVDSRPAFLIVGATHAPHVAGSELALRMASLLVSRAKTNAEAKALLERHTFYFVPRPSPDATEACFAAPWFATAFNARETDDDRDFSTNEDGPEDLNGDGYITAMRIADPAGDWMPHPQEPRVLVAPDRNKGERGAYRLSIEGRDNDGDGQFQEDAAGGVAFDRNFTFQYPFFRPGAGPHQVSEPETRSIADFCFAHANIAAVFSFSPEDNLFHPWKPDPGVEGQRIKTRLMSADAPTIERLAETFRKLHGGENAPPPVDGEGSFVEWAYFHYGRWSLSTRGWWVPQVAAPEGAPAVDGRAADELNLLRWLAREQIDGFVPWTPVAHPDFPGQQVEVGGFKPFVALNPPAKELDGLAEKHLAFLESLPAELPQLKVAAPTVTALGDGVFRVKALVTNEGAMPTSSEMGRVTGQPFPVQLRLELPPQAKLLTGVQRTRLGVLAGHGGRVEQQWVIHLEGPAAANVTIRASSPTVGEATATVELK